MRLKNNIAIGLIIFLLGLIIGFYIFFHLAQQEALKKIETEYKDNKIKLDGMLNSQVTLGKSIQSQNEAIIKLSALRKRFLRTEEIPEATVKFNSMLKDKKLSPQNADFGNIEKGKEFDSALVTFSTSGAKEDIESFLVYIENFEKAVSVENVTISPEKDNKFKLTMVLKMYVYDDTTMIIKSVTSSAYGSSAGGNNLFDIFKLR